MTFGVFDLGSVLGQAESIKSARFRNELAGINIEQMRQRQENLRKIRQLRTQFDNGGEIVRRLRESGEHSAADQFIGTQVQQKMQGIRLLKEFAPLVKDEKTYEELRSQLLQGGYLEEDDMPPQYDRSFFKREEKKQRQLLKQFEVATGVKEGIRRNRQVIIDQATGNVIYESPEFADPESERIGLAKRKEKRDVRSEQRQVRQEQAAERREIDMAALRPIATPKSDSERKINRIYRQHVRQGITPDTPDARSAYAAHEPLSPDEKRAVTQANNFATNFEKAVDLLSKGVDPSAVRESLPRFLNSEQGRRFKAIMARIEVAEVLRIAGTTFTDQALNYIRRMTNTDWQDDPEQIYVNLLNLAEETDSSLGALMGAAPVSRQQQTAAKVRQSLRGTLRTLGAARQRVPGAGPAREAAPGALPSVPQLSQEEIDAILEGAR